MFFVSAIRPKITTWCRDQSPLPLMLSFTPLRSSPPLQSHPHYGRMKKARKEREREKRILPRFSLVISRPRAPLAPVYVSRFRCLNGLVSSRLYLSRGSLETPFLILLAVVLILAKCCDQHPPFVCPPPFVSTSSFSFALMSVTSFSTSKRCEWPRGSWILGAPSCESCFCDGVLFATS